jgi:PAS domain S-box-containing protein
VTEDCGEEGDRATETEAGGVDPESIPLPYLRLSRTGTVEAVNRAWLDRLGYERETVLDRSFTEFLTADSITRFRDQFSGLLDGGELSDVAATLSHASGHRVAVRIDGRAESTAGLDTRAHLQFQEPTTAETRVRDHEAKIEALHEVAMDMQAARSAAVVYRRLVEAAEAVLDFEIATVETVRDGELATRAQTESTPSEARIEVPTEDETALSARARHRDSSTLIRDLNRGLESEMGYRSALAVPIGDFGVFRAVDETPGAFDQTDLDLAELLVSHVRNALSRLDRVETLRRRTASLSRERDRLAAVFEAVPEPVAHVRYENGQPRLVAVNSAFEAVFGHDASEVEGTNVNDLIVPPDHRESAFDIDTAAETASSLEREVVRTAADGPRTFRLRSTVLQTESEPEILAIYVDLTESKARERRLERENERLERFASIVSHDLRSPLTVARGRLNLAAEDCESEHLGAATRAIERTDAIVEDVLTLTRDGQTVCDTEREPVELAELARTCWESVDSTAATLAISATGTVVADRSRLRRVLENLFRNAIEHVGPGVSVTVEDIEGGFAVADDGPGIPESDRASVFETGYTTSRDGTGLGLDIVQDIVDAHGWTVDLATAESGGARFEIRTG